MKRGIKPPNSRHESIKRSGHQRLGRRPGLPCICPTRISSVDPTIALGPRHPLPQEKASPRYSSHMEVSTMLTNKLSLEVSRVCLIQPCFINPFHKVPGAFQLFADLSGRTRDAGTWASGILICPIWASPVDLTVAHSLLPLLPRKSLDKLHALKYLQQAGQSRRAQVEHVL